MSVDDSCSVRNVPFSKGRTRITRMIADVESGEEGAFFTERTHIALMIADAASGHEGCPLIIFEKIGRAVLLGRERGFTAGPDRHVPGNGRKSR